MNKNIESAYALAQERYAELGVDTEAAIAALAKIPISLHCWQGDDVGGFEKTGGELGGGLAVTGNYPGKARTAAELRGDLEKALSLIPGKHRLNLHACYAELGGKKVERSEYTIEQFQGWVDWCKAQGLGLDFNPSYFAHPLAADGQTLSHQDKGVRQYWIDHGIACRRIAAEAGRQLGKTVVTNFWIPDGSKDQPADRKAPRERLAASLDAVFAPPIDAKLNLDAVEAKLFGIGSESYVVGSHEFYLGYAITRQKLLCLDAGHFHPTESIADKISSVLQFVPALLLHVSRGVRWDSDHVVLLDDPTRAIMEEVVRGGFLDRTSIGLDFFDASINRIAAWVIGTRNAIKALLLALLEPAGKLRAAEAAGDFTGRLALFEELKSLPFGAVWDEHCRRANVPVGTAWLEEVRGYEKAVSLRASMKTLAALLALPDAKSAAIPEGCRKLAGGVSHRNSARNEFAPEGRRNKQQGTDSVAPAGANAFGFGIRWLTPPANFREPSGFDRVFHGKLSEARWLALPILLVLLAGSAPAQVPANAELSPIRSWFIAPTRVVWQSKSGVKNAANLLQPKPGQAVLKEPQPPCVLTATEGKPAGILLDFGTELNGSVEIFTPITPGKEPRSVRVRFGESVSEAMAELGERDAQNDHAMRDQTVVLPWLGKKTVGPSGFRFVRIDALDPKTPVSLSQVRAVLQMRDLPRVGSFRCSDERLNKIWETGAYTVQLNMQEYLWDGIKRDRLVWIGDMHPEVSTINAVFGFNEVVPKSLDLTRDITPVTTWMNGISSYSMWWVLIHEEMWMHHGDRKYLEAQQSYLTPLLKKLAGLIGPDGKEHIDGMRFLDWPSSPNKQGVTAGLQALLVMTLESGARLMTTLGDKEAAALCTDAAARGRKVVPEVNASKSGAALLALAGMMDAKKTSDDVLKVGGTNGVSTFYGFYVLQALAKSGDIDTALDFISTYWGAMLDFGATTFWEDFDLAWTKDAARIDELVPAGKKDLHGDFGAYCYVGFRHSLCHGWASGPTAWLSQNVLGVRPLDPGFKRVRIAPQLGRLAWAEGAYPTPLGPIKVRHERQPDGSVKSHIQAPAGILIERQ